jgi:hypothetical protein
MSPPRRRYNPTSVRTTDFAMRATSPINIWQHPPFLPCSAACSPPVPLLAVEKVLQDFFQA